MPAREPGDTVVLDELRRLGRADQVIATSRLSGGTQADAWLITYADGTQVVGKTITGAAPDVFAAEAGGLAEAHQGAGAAAPSVSRICCPYLASLFSPTPLMPLSSARVDGDSAAICRSVASWKIT